MVVTLLQGVNAAEPLLGLIREEPFCQSIGIFFPSATRDSSLSLCFRGLMWTNCSLFSKIQWGKVILEDTVHIPISVLKLGSCVTLGHPGITHHASITLPFTGMPSLSFISLCPFIFSIYKHHYINNVVIFYKFVRRLTAVPLNMPGNKIFFIF